MRGWFARILEVLLAWVGQRPAAKGAPQGAGSKRYVDECRIAKGHSPQSVVVTPTVLTKAPVALPPAIDAAPDLARVPRAAAPEEAPVGETASGVGGADGIGHYVDATPVTGPVAHVSAWHEEPAQAAADLSFQPTAEASPEPRVKAAVALPPALDAGPDLARVPRAAAPEEAPVGETASGVGGADGIDHYVDATPVVGPVARVSAWHEEPAQAAADHSFQPTAEASPEPRLAVSGAVGSEMGGGWPDDSPPSPSQRWRPS